MMTEGSNVAPPLGVNGRPWMSCEMTCTCQTSGAREAEALRLEVSAQPGCTPEQIATAVCLSLGLMLGADVDVAAGKSPLDARHAAQRALNAAWPTPTELEAPLFWGVL